MKPTNIVSLIFLAIIGGIFYVILSVDQTAKDQAEEFCASLKPGDDVSALQDRAVASGALKNLAQWKDAGAGKRSLMAVYVGAFPMNRHICNVEEQDGKVTVAHYTHLD